MDKTYGIIFKRIFITFISRIIIRTSKFAYKNKNPTQNDIKFDKNLEKTCKKYYNIYAREWVSKPRGVTMAKKSLKDALYQYFAQAHFNAMSAEQFARFKDYIKAKDFQGNMRWWEKSFMENGNKKDVPDFTKQGGDYELSGADWELLYDWFQNTLESMYTNLDTEYAHTLFVPGFIKKWFGPGRIFQSTTATSQTTKALEALATFLKTDEGKKLGSILTKAPQLKDVFGGELTFDTFVTKLKAEEYNKDLKFRKKVNDVVAYISQNMPQPGYQPPHPSVWPADLGYETDTSGSIVTVSTLKEPLSTQLGDFNAYKPDSWVNTQVSEKDRFKFDESKKTVLIDIFKKNYKPLLNTLVTGEKKIREEFQKHDQGSGSLITEQLNKAFKDTDYDNKESKDYIVPKQTEERNFIDRIKKFKDDTYENYFEQFFEPRYGAHVYHTTYARTVGEAFDKVGIKPSGGIDGILAKKDDIIKEINKKAAGKALKHFNWFCTTMEEIKKSIPKAYNDALRNPHQMRAVVSQIIIKALKTKPYDDGEAKTAMELLALTRYGVMASRFREGLSDGLKDVKLFSDDKLSWNKNEGIKIVTGAIDTTLKFGVKALALGGTVGYNLVKNRFKRKFGKDISGNEDLAAAYKTWKENDKKAYQAELASAETNKKLYNEGYSKSGAHVNKDNVNDYGDWVFYKKFGNLFDIVPPASYETVKKELSKKSEKDFTNQEKDEAAAIEKYDKLSSDKYVKQYLKEHNLWDGKTQITPALLETGFAKVNSEHTNFGTINSTTIEKYTNALSEQQTVDSNVRDLSSQINEIKSERLQEIKEQLKQLKELLEQLNEQAEQSDEQPEQSKKQQKNQKSDNLNKKIEKYKEEVKKLEKYKTILEKPYATLSDLEKNELSKCFNTTEQKNLKKLEKDLGDAQGKLSTADGKLNTIKTETPNIEGFAANATDLEDDVVKYKKLMLYSETPAVGATEEQKKELDNQQRQQWRKDNADDYAKLIAFWDELDTFTKTHSFKFGNMKLRRDLWLKNFNRDKDAGVISPMEEEANEFAESYYDNINYGQDR